MSTAGHIEFTTASEAETIALGERLGSLLRAGDVVLLEGDLGAGKTRFVRGLVRGLGHDERLVSSPTYVLAHEYATNPASPALIHVDAYRVRSDDELEGLGLDHAMAGGAAIAVEWASRLGDALGVVALSIEIEHAGGDGRSVTFRWKAVSGSDWASRLESL
jgi:tRNA threonylcarbamoyladenosine biosynthesis protein TsaE